MAYDIKKLESLAWMPDSGKWLSPKKAASYLGCSKAFLDRDRITRLHNIPFARLGRHIRYDVTDLDAFLERSKARSEDDI